MKDLKLFLNSYFASITAVATKSGATTSATVVKPMHSFVELVFIQLSMVTSTIKGELLRASSLFFLHKTIEEIV